MSKTHPSPNVRAGTLWKIPAEMALELVENHLGSPEAWAASALVQYRLQDDFQADWKLEVGHWLHAAKQHEALERVVAPILGERDRRNRKYPATRHLQDPRHLKLHQHLAAAMTCHYLTGTGWSCRGFDTEIGGSVDIDLEMSAGDGTLVKFQVKAPDQPGKLDQGCYKNGDKDHRVIESLGHAVGQLHRPSHAVQMVALFAQRATSLALHPSCLIKQVYGRTVAHVGEVVLQERDFGVFLKGDWDHVAGLVVLDLLRTYKATTYTCTVMLNPRAAHPANPDWFPEGHVAILEGDSFRWLRGAPSLCFELPTGTRLVGPDDEFAD
jgi:hypothetical protein